MKRTAQQWAKCDPRAMSGMSRAAIAYALADAQADILEMANALRVIGYPKRGTEEESMTFDHVAQLVIDRFSLADLEH